MIKLGDVTRRKLKIYDPAGNQTTESTVDAEVVYIHPQRRFYTLRCRLPGGRSFCETEYFYPRCGMGKN